MPLETRAAFEPVEADLVGFDVSGFSRFAETWLSTVEGSGVDDLARLWESAVAPQIDRLIDAGYQIADVCGDGVTAYRSEALDERAAMTLLRSLETAFREAAPGLSLRTARTKGPMVLVEAEAVGKRYRWASGEGVHQLHVALGAKRRVPADASNLGIRSATGHGEALAQVWSRAGAEIRQMATMFVRYAAEPWMWSDRARLDELVHISAAAATERGGRLAKVTHDDKGLLLRCEFVGLDRDERVAAAQAGMAILAVHRSADDLGVAVDAGWVYRGPVRVGDRYELTIHGAAVNRAAKTAARERGLVVLAPPDDWLSDQLEAAGLAIDTEAGAWRPRAGRGPPVPARPAPPEALVGRASALAALRAAHEGIDGAAASVVVVGAAGIGKTALVRRFVADLGPDARVAWSAARPNTGVSGPWPDLLRSLVHAAYGASDARVQLSRAFSAAGLREDEYGVLSGRGLDLFAASPHLAMLEPFELRDRLDRAFCALLQATTEAGATVVVLEDVHWLTPEGWRWLELALASASGALCLLTLRDGEPSPPLPEAMSAVRSVCLGPLEPRDALSLVEQVRPELASRKQAAAEIAALCAGRPLLLEQMAQAWPVAGSEELETFGHVLGERAAGLPGSDAVLQRVLDVRLDGLSAAETHLLRLLAVEGRSARVDTLDRAVESDELAMTATSLNAASLVQSYGGEVELRHALIAEAVLRRTPNLLLRALHGRAARRLALEPAADPATVAAHWLASRAPGRAAHWYARAGAEAERTAMLRAAVGYYDAALGAAPDAARLGPIAVGWRARLAAAAFGVGDLGRALVEAARCGAPVSRRPGASARMDQARRRALLVQSEIATFTADIPLAVASLARLRRLKIGGSEGLRGREAAFWAYVLAILRARPFARSALDRAAVHGDRDRYYTQASRGLIHTCFAEWTAAEEALTEAMDLAPAERFPHENEIAATLLALGRYLRGDAGRSLALFDAIFESGRRRDNAMHEAWGLYGSAQALLALGRREAAGERLGRAETLLDGHPDRQSRLICTGLRVELARQAGDRDALLTAMQTNLAMSASMPATNFGSFEGYAATPLAALEQLCDARLSSTERAALTRHAQRGRQALGRYAIIFPVGRPRVALCAGLAALARGRRGDAAARFRNGHALAKRLGMGGEAANLAAALERAGYPLGDPT